MRFDESPHGTEDFRLMVITRSSQLPARPERLGGGLPGRLRGIVLALLVVQVLLTGCTWLNLGKWRGIESVPADEHYYLLKDVFLTASSAFNPKEVFDHNMNETVNLMFSPKNEKNSYVAESIWYDPSGNEYKTIRITYDKKREQREGVERTGSSTSRIHTMPTRDLFNHKPGMWKVALKLDGELARRLNFTIR
jgi:hypothetical protein